LAQKLVNVLCGSAVEAQEAWNELKPAAKLSARHYRLPIELLAYKTLASCFTQDLVSVREFKAPMQGLRAPHDVDFRSTQTDLFFFSLPLCYPEYRHISESIP
jgi:hypothetical protein